MGCGPVCDDLPGLCDHLIGADERPANQVAVRTVRNPANAAPTAVKQPHPLLGCAACPNARDRVESTWGAVPALLLVRFPRPLAEPGVLLVTCSQTLSTAMRASEVIESPTQNW